MTVPTEAQEIYLGKINEALARIDACAAFLATSSSTNSVPMLEAAALQARKAFEAVAYAAIAPNKTRYEAFRAQAERPADYRKDYNARAILQYIAKINPDFYPTPLLPPTQPGPGHWHFELKPDGFLTKAKFESFYDRLGKFLHADNPWGNDKGLANLASDLPTVMSQLRGLLALHKTIVRTPSFTGVWVIEVPTDGRAPHILTGQATGEFAVVAGGS
jgi:hypothetical protein